MKKMGCMRLDAANVVKNAKCHLSLILTDPSTVKYAGVKGDVNAMNDKVGLGNMELGKARIIASPNMVLSLKILSSSCEV